MPTSFPTQCLVCRRLDVDLQHALFPRTICGKQCRDVPPVQRTSQRAGRCLWHRLVPLSKGRLDGDTVVCGYHGLKYNAQGPLHLHALAGDHQPVGLRALLSGWSNGIVSSGCGWAIRRSRTLRWCRTCTGTTTRPGPATARPFM